MPARLFCSPTCRKDDHEIIRRIGNADAVPLQLHLRASAGQSSTHVRTSVTSVCVAASTPKASANVDIAYAREKNIRVLGIRDYGDRGVVEYVLHELTGLLHGFGLPMPPRRTD